jgi:uncharacterized protein YdeI (YjbR/CyaY-like superfamily)
MTKAGIAAIERAKQEGTWDMPKPIPISDDHVSILEDAIRSVEPAASNFAKMSPSVRWTYTLIDNLSISNM